MHRKFISIGFKKKLQFSHSLLSTCYLLLITVYHLPITNYHLPTTNFSICKSVIFGELRREEEPGDLVNLVGWLLCCSHWFSRSIVKPTAGLEHFALNQVQPRSNHYRKKSKVKKQWTFSAKVLCPFPIDFEKIEMDK